MRETTTIVILLLTLLCAAIQTPAQQNQRRNRGETFYLCQNSNTAGPGDIWVSLRGIGYVWDDPNVANTIKWYSNLMVRVWPEIYLQGGVADFLSVHASSRVLSHGWRPGWFDGGIKLTWPNNQDLRFHGAGLSVDYRYQTRESGPTLSGAIGFMPEGFVVKGHNCEMMAIYELDLTPKLSYLPLRFLVNAGLRLPLSKRQEMYQLLANVGVVYSGYGFDFFVQYSLEAFNNIFKPKIVEQDGGTTRFMVNFSENPMYVTFGGDVRYDNGWTLSLAVPLLVSTNWGSRKRWEDESELHQNSTPGLFAYEKAHDIVIGFDPWFVKWKIVGSLSFPLRFKMTGAEMMRNYLIMKNRKQAKKIDIDNQLQLQNKPAPLDEAKEKDDAQRRLEEIKKKRETLLK